MPTVDKDIAEQQIAHCKTLKQPKMYCIVRYLNTLSGEEGYSLCYKERHYRGLFESPAIADVVVLWASARSGLRAGPSHADSGPLTDQELYEEMVGDPPPPSPVKNGRRRRASRERAS